VAGAVPGRGGEGARSRIDKPVAAPLN